MSTRAVVIVVDPATRTVREKPLSLTTKVLEKMVGGEPDRFSLGQYFPRHTLVTAENIGSGQWSLRAGDGSSEEVFHGPGVVYGVLNSEPTSHSIALEQFKNSIHWHGQENTEASA